jgi:transcriptional regulator with XRE-family HTH domain
VTENKVASLGLLLGRNIAGRRKILGLTQAVLAEQLGIDTVTVSRFERGSHLPSLLRLEHIADILQMPVAQLLSESTNLINDQGLLLQNLIANLSEVDRQLVIDMVGVWCNRLRKPD